MPIGAVRVQPFHQTSGTIQMPKRISKRLSFEAESEKKPLDPKIEAGLKRSVLERAPANLAKFEAAKAEADLFYALPGAASAAFNLERYDLAEELARRALAIAPSYESNWNFGNAIHVAHTVLGLVALHKDDLPLACEELRKSGDTTGSPQLGSFGPSMRLAKALLHRGQFEVVLSYFGQCRVFWEMGNAWLDIWEAKARARQVPNFTMHGYR